MRGRLPKWYFLWSKTRGGGRGGGGGGLLCIVKVRSEYDEEEGELALFLLEWERTRISVGKSAGLNMRRPRSLCVRDCVNSA